jgi:uncharacterized membrane protein (UPF0127 family)
VSPKRLAGTLLIVVGALLSVAAPSVAPAAASAPATVPTARTLQDALDAATPAVAPFPELTETTVHVGRRTLRVVIADDDAERTEGLRARADIGPYDGMLFVFDEPTTTSFTMSTVRTALDIGFYRASGRAVDRLRMKPCSGGESDCPSYRASGAFRSSLETLPGDLPRGRLRG